MSGDIDSRSPPSMPIMVPHIMNIPDRRAFVAMAEAGSVDHAARRLNLTQPAVARRLQNFEAALGGADDGNGERRHLG